MARSIRAMTSPTTWCPTAHTAGQAYSAQGDDRTAGGTPGCSLEARIRLPKEVGAWAAIWTWRDGDQQIDVFEYHPDNPDLLESTNHVRRANRYHHDEAVRPAARVDLRTVFGSRSVDWWLNGRRVFADGRGVNRTWYAHLIVNLSVCAGRYHPPPQPETTEMSYEVSHLVVRRPMTTGTSVEATTSTDGAG
ncbi:beta-glucanase [Streptomyces luteogriseus]|uniref:beta-glucanase n=1 Tax=Streptomyces luteogriseus TaxID=68233 RepID=UPI003790ED8D